MQSLRRARFIARLVLAWFALTLGAAIASPLLKPVGLELICSAGGSAKFVQHGSGSEQAPHTLDCPMCVAPHAAAPPPSLAFNDFAHARAQAVPVARTAQLTAATIAPPSARGPPPFLAV